MPLRTVLSRFWDLSVWGQFTVFASVMLAWTAVLLASAYHTASISRDAAARVQDTQKVIDTADQALGAIIDMETGYRGFLLTGQIDFLQPYEVGRENFAREMSALEQADSNSSDEAQHWNEMRRLVYEWEWEVTIPGIEQRMQMSMGNGTLDDVIEGQSVAKARLDQIRQLMTDGINVERGELIDLTAAADIANARLQLVLVCGSALMALLGLGLSMLVATGIKRNLHGLIRANERIMQGDLAYRMRLSSHNEFGLVAAAFDQMADELQANRERQDAMLSALRRFAQEDNPETVLSELVQAALDFTRADGAVVYRSDPARSRLVRVRRAGVRALEPEFVSPSTGLVGRALELRKAQIENNYQSAAIALPEIVKAGMTAVAVAPLIFEGQSLGAIVAWTGKGSWGFSEIDGSSLEILAAVGAATLAHREHTARLRRQAETDALTGLNNRRKGFERLQTLVDAAAAGGEPVCVALIDLDHFKSINDQHGHEVGDNALRRVGQLLAGALGPHDVAARWGGEEFVLGMYGASVPRAVERLEMLLEQFNAVSGETGISIGFSGGVAAYPLNEMDLPALLRAADAALYAAKKAGRGRIVAAPTSNLNTLAA